MMIGDLHCDLLSYLAEKDTRTIHDAVCRCSLPQLKKGEVAYQTLAIYAPTGKNSVSFAHQQLQIFQSLLEDHPETFQKVKPPQISLNSSRILLAAAIENASGLCDETEPLDNCFKRFDQFCTFADPIIYIGMTWNHENRFGGGNLTQIGLKRDGELLLEYMDKRAVCIDLSHASDPLVYDILHYIDKKGLNVRPIASHSNFRTIADQPRNLPDELAKEIVKRGGIIGFNLFKSFVGRTFPDDFLRQAEYAKSLGILDHYCFGADFFYDGDYNSTSFYPFPFFYEPFSNAASYPDLIKYLSSSLTEKELEKLAYRNLEAFLKRIFEKQS